ncbi:hypothetical protein AAC387_Pa01g0149 [Persea americana]
MAERVQPDPSTDSEPEPPLTLKPPPGNYIVQFPRDQIYRVPPPENADFAERFRTQTPQKSSINPRLKWVLAILFSLAVLIAIILTLVFTLSKPSPPAFHINQFSTKNTPPSRYRKPEYNITLRVDNENSRMGLRYESGGSASLEYKGLEIAHGKTPSFFQPNGDKTAFRLALKGLNVELPREIKRSFESTKGSKGSVTLTLTLTVPVGVKMGGTWIRSRKMVVGCDLTVNTLGKGSRVTSQECHSMI